jgi:hypothetical protein
MKYLMFLFMFLPACGERKMIIVENLPKDKQTETIYRVKYEKINVIPLENS